MSITLSKEEYKKLKELVDLSTDSYHCDKCKQYEFITLKENPEWMIQVRYKDEIINDKQKYELIRCETCDEEFFLCQACCPIRCNVLYRIKGLSCSECKQK